MTYANQGLIFESALFADDDVKFLVTNVDGYENVSGLFRFDLDVTVKLPVPMSPEVDLDLANMVRNDATLKILANQGDPNDDDDWHEFAGVLAVFEQKEEVSPGWGRFRAVLVPKAWVATRTTRSRVFEDVAINDLINTVLTTSGLVAADIDVQLAKLPTTAASVERSIYPQHEYLAQYEETDWQFLTRRLEHEGIFYYFTNDAGAEKVVFGDSGSNYETTAFALSYNPTGEGSGNAEPAEIRSFYCRLRPSPTKVAVREYNWQTTTTTKHEATLDANGTGEQILFNERFLNEGQGTELAAIRKETIAARTETFHGSSNARSLRPGKTIVLSNHYRDEFDGTYAVTQVKHIATQNVTVQAANVTIGGCTYTNTFKAVKHTVAWRPRLKAPKPIIHGLMTGQVVGDTDDKRYAVLDTDGRYLVTMQYDTSETPIKRWIRMSQPSAGPSSGLHFPLNPDVEVVVAHIDGDPDRPIIVGAVPNPDNESPSTEDNVSTNAVQTRAGNMLHFDDDAAASGFVKMDASRSQVSDQRRRGVLDPLTSFTSWAAAQASGSGNAEVGTTEQADSATPPTQPANPTSHRSATKPPSDTAPPAPRQSSSPMPSSGSGSATNTSATAPTLERAWRAFFDGDAMRELADLGPYRPESSATISDDPSWDGMPVSDAIELGLPNKYLDEANIVKLLNHVAKDKTDGIDDIPDSDVPAGDELKGKIRDLILAKAQNFEGSAAGSTVSVDIGDKFSYSLGDTFEYGDGSNAVSIGTGGYTREETRGNGQTEIFTWGTQETTTVHQGTQSETTTWHGQRHSNETINDPSLAHTDHYSTDTSFTYRGGWTATCAIAVSGQTNTEIFVGGYNANTVSLAIFVDIGINVAGKFELDVTLESAKVTVGFSQEFELSRAHGCLNQDEVFLTSMEAALKVSVARLQNTEATLKEEALSLKTEEASLSRTIAAMENQGAVMADTCASLKEYRATLLAQQDALATKQLSMAASKTAASNLQTAAFHSVQ